MERPDIPAGLPDDIEDRKETARRWFEELRDQICAAFEKIEDDLTGPFADYSPGRFEQTPWQRDGGAGGGGTAIGFFAGRSYQKVATWFGEGSALAVLAIALVAVIVWHLRRRRKQKA